MQPSLAKQTGLARLIAALAGHARRLEKTALSVLTTGQLISKEVAAVLAAHWVHRVCG